MDAVRDFVLALAPFLSPWTFDAAYYVEHYQTVRMVNADLAGAAIYFREGRSPQRVEISGLYPAEMYMSESLRITVSVKREPARAAQDIQRRFIEPYYEIFKQTMERAYRAGQQRQQAREVADELAAMLGETVRDEGRGDFTIYSHHVTFRVSSGSDTPYIRMERMYNLTPTLAVAIARVFAQQ